MKTNPNPDRYLERRGRVWYYVRRVPSSVQRIEGRTRVKACLRTHDLAIARERRDRQAAADEAYWETLRPATEMSPRKPPKARRRGAHAEVLDELANVKAMLAQVLHQLAEERTPSGRKRGTCFDPPALSPVRPEMRISEAFRLYVAEIAVDETAGKSPEQRYNWEKSKLRSVQCFIDINGDLDMRAVDRSHARAVHRYWASRIRPAKGEPTAAGSTGKRVMGDLNRLYRRYFEHLGEDGRDNPFRALRFREEKLRTTEPFTDNWVRTRILHPGVLEGFRREGALLALALIETGCRPSELANIDPANIRLEDLVPHIRIRQTPGRQLKSRASIRDIPLVGVSLAAMRCVPDGFPHYRERGHLRSAAMMKAFRARQLLPTSAHRIYSFRHSFEKRMLEAGLDHDLRCTLMGHSNSRPQYGDGGSLAWRRDQLLKIAHPVPDRLLQAYPFVESS